MKKTITLVVNTKNEEQNLVSCLKSARGVDEIIVVDMQSTDLTQGVARLWGAKIIEVPDSGYVETARNVGPAAAACDFVLILDADERLSPDGVERLRSHAKTADAWGIPVVTWFGDHLIRGSGFADHVKPRFFKRGVIRWPETIHAMPVCTTDRTGTATDVLIHNHAFRDVEHLFEKCIRYGQHETVVDDRPVMGSLFDGLWEIVRRYDPVIDGPHSMALSLGVAMMRMTAGAFDLERSNWLDTPPSRKELFDAFRDFAAELPDE